ncbi:MAG: YgiT-type zinc finger protein [Myxococcaceae bacterium]
MTRPKKTDVCEYCSAELHAQEEPVTVYRHRAGDHFIFEQVPARVCPRCGERYFSSHVAREMDRVMKKPSARRPMVKVPVIRLRKVG